MLAELADVISRDKFSVTGERQTANFLSILGRNVQLVTPAKQFKAVPEDPDDDLVLNTAYEGRVSHIVSGDKHLLKLGRFRGIRIVTVSDMLDIL